MILPCQSVSRLGPVSCNDLAGAETISCGVLNAEAGRWRSLAMMIVLHPTGTALASHRRNGVNMRYAQRLPSPIAMHGAVIEYDRTMSRVEAELLLLNIARAVASALTPCSFN